MNKSTVHILMRTGYVLLVCTSMLTVSFFAAPYIYPFLISICIAVCINPLVRFLEIKLHFPRPLAAGGVLLLVLAVCVGLLAAAVNEIAHGASYLAHELPKHLNELVGFFQQIIEKHVMPLYEKSAAFQQELSPNQQETVSENLDSIIQQISASLGTMLQNFLGAIPGFLAKAPQYISVFIFSLLGAFFISKDWDKCIVFLKKLLPEIVSSSIQQVLNGLKKACIGFLKAQALLLSISFSLILLGLSILRIEHPLTAALLITMVDIIPYLGTGIVFLPWIVYSFLTGNFTLTIGLAVLYVIIVLQRQLMEPNVLSVHIGLNPLATLIAVFACFQLFGFIGMLIGPGLLVILNTLFHTGILQRIWHYIRYGSLT